MFEQFQNRLCVQVGPMIDKGFMSKTNYDWLCHEEKLTKLRTGGNGRQALVEYDTMPERIKSKIIAMYGNPYERKAEPIATEGDARAVSYFSGHLLPNGDHISAARQKEYNATARLFNAIEIIWTNYRAARAKHGASVKGFWPMIAERAASTNDGQKKFTNYRSLQRAYDKYIECGYAALVHGGFGNDNKLKVTADLENLLMSIYTMPNKPFALDVHDLYTEFMKGNIELFNTKTGELFDPKSFVDGHGNPIEITRQTVWNYLNQPDNRSTVDKLRNGQFQYQGMHRPHHNRRKPTYAFSKVTMDDRDLPRKMDNGQRVKAYYVYDVASGAVVGAAYSKSKDEELFLDCMRDMFRTIHREGLCMPLEVEVENHLVNKFFDDLALMFPHVKICNPGNSQEKHAEHFNRAKKYEVEKKNHKGIGRWWAHGEAYRVDVMKADDEYKEKKYAYETLVADDKADIAQYNNNKHRNEKRYGGKSRWQVLLGTQNPKAPTVPMVQVTKSIGYKARTSIQRNQYLMLRGDKYAIPNVSVMDKLATNDYGVDAYYLPNSMDMVEEVYLFQNNKYICRCTPLGAYNTAKAEWTDADADSYTEQAKFVSEFDARKKQQVGELAKIGIMKTTPAPPWEGGEQNLADIIVPGVEESDEEVWVEALKQVQGDNADIKRRALESL